MKVDYRFDSTTHHFTHPLELAEMRPYVVYRISEGAQDTYVYPTVEFVAVLVDGFTPAAHPPDCLDNLTSSLLLSNTHYPKASHVMVHDESMSNEAKYLCRQGNEFSTVPVSIMRGLEYFGWGVLSTVTLYYVTVPLPGLQHFTKHTMARNLDFDNLRVSQLGGQKLDGDTFQVYFDVSKLSLKGLRNDLAASLVLGFKEQHTLFLELEADLLTDAFWKKVRGVFQKTHILQLNGHRFMPGKAFDDLLYRQGDYNRIVDLRLANIHIAPAEYPTFLEFLRQASSLRQFVLQGWKNVALQDHGGTERRFVSDLFCALGDSYVEKIHFDKVPYEFLDALEGRLGDIRLNDIYICALRPTENSEYSRMPHLKGELVNALLEQVMANRHLGVICNDKQRSDAYEKRSSGFHVEIDDPYYNFSIFTDDECQGILNHCCRNYNVDYLQRQEQELAGVAPLVFPRRPVERRLERDIDAAMDPADNNDEEGPEPLLAAIDHDGGFDDGDNVHNVISPENELETTEEYYDSDDDVYMMNGQANTPS